MQIVTPDVFLIGATQIIDEGVQAYLESIGAPNWETDADTGVEFLPELMGRMCYRSFEPGLNPNVTKVRDGNRAYLANVIAQRHGSVTEHSVLNFIFHNVSRVFTHELVRHRVGVAISQESLRFVRLDELRFWMPSCIRENPRVLEIFEREIRHAEQVQKELALVFDVDNPSYNFAYKKEVTSAMRRLAPDGLATSIGWSANVRTLRHVIEMRTAPSAEEEIRVVFAKVADLLCTDFPHLFGDFTRNIVQGIAHYSTPNVKI